MSSTLRAFGLLAPALLALLAPAAHADAIDRYLARQQAMVGIPAIVVGVIRDGKLVEQRARGLANVELGVKATPRHVFEIGSISKQFTAYAILILAEEGKVALDAPLGNYLDDVPDAWKSVTLHRLLTHTSGIPDLEEAFGYGVYRETPTDAAFIVRLAAVIEPEAISSPVARRIFVGCCRLAEQGMHEDFGRLMAAFDDPEFKNLLVQLDESAATKPNADRERWLADLLETARRRGDATTRRATLAAARQSDGDAEQLLAQFVKDSNSKHRTEFERRKK